MYLLMKVIDLSKLKLNSYEVVYDKNRRDDLIWSIFILSVSFLSLAIVISILGFLAYLVFRMFV